MSKAVENKDKFYVPDISEFHAGFEYEEFIRNSWEKTIIYNDFSTSQKWEGSINDVLYSLDNNKIRIKYLDKSDIESLGFKCIIKDQYIDNENTILIDSDYFVQILNKGNKYSFQGTIKNKSELKRLLKQIGIDESVQKDSK